MSLVMSNSPYETLQDYMEGTGTNATRLCELANAKLRGEQRMSRALFGMILSGARRCSGEKAWALHQITGVSMEELTRWPRYPKPGNSGSNDRGHHA